MKTITKLISLIMLFGAFVACTIVMPSASCTIVLPNGENANISKDIQATSEQNSSNYQRPTPTTTVGSSDTYTRPTPTTTVGSGSDAYTRPNPTTTVGTSSDGYNRPRPTRSYSDSISSAPTNKNETNAVADTTNQVRGRVRR